MRSRTITKLFLNRTIGPKLDLIFNAPTSHFFKGKKAFFPKGYVTVGASEAIDIPKDRMLKFV